MAVQKSKKSRSRRDMRRTHDSFATNELTMCSETGATHVLHHVTADGYYKGELIRSARKTEQSGNESE